MLYFMCTVRGVRFYRREDSRDWIKHEPGVRLQVRRKPDRKLQSRDEMLRIVRLAKRS